MRVRKIRTKGTNPALTATMEVQALPALTAQGGVVLSWPHADTATAGYRLYRSAEPFANGAHIDGSLQIAGSSQIDRESRALYPDAESYNPAVPIVRCRPGSTSIR